MEGEKKDVLEKVSGLFPSSKCREVIGRGVINRVFRIESEGLICKWYSDDAESLRRFQNEMEDLELLEAYLPVPDILKKDSQFMLMKDGGKEKIPFKLVTKLLLHLHSETKQSQFGFPRSSFYGKCEYKNDWNGDWWDFFQTTRWKVLIQKVKETKQREDIVAWLYFIQDHFTYFGRPPHASLLHGDLFANNIVYDGKQVTFIDPACFFGDHLMDFAKYHNKFSSHPRTLLYQFYFALDFDIYTKQLQLENAHFKRPFSKLLHWFLKQSSITLNVSHLLFLSSSFDSKVEGIVKQDARDFKFSIGTIYFGCFNPLHKNHQRLIPRAQNLLKESFGPTLVQSFYCPAPDTYVSSKTSTFLNWNQQVQLLSSYYPVMTYVENHNTTLQLIEKAFPNKKWYVILGSDTIQKALQMIDVRYGLIIIKRNEFEIPIDLREKLIKEGRKLVLIDNVQEQETISSSKIRENPKWIQDWLSSNLER